MRIKHNINFLRNDLLRVFLLLWNADKRTAFINMLLQLVQAVLPVISLYFIKALIEAITKGNRPYESIVVTVVAFGLVQFFLAITAQYASYINIKHQETLTIYLANEVLNKAIDVDYEYYENPEYHDTLHLAQQQSASRATVLLGNFNALLLNSLSLLFLIAFFFSLHSLFALLFMVLSLPLALIKWFSGFALLRIERKFAPLEREANYLHSILTGVGTAKEVRVFGYGINFIKKFNTIKRTIYREKAKLNLKIMWFSLIAESVEIIAMTIIFCMLTKYTLEKSITIGVFVIYIQGFQRLQNTSKSFLQSVVQLFQQRVFLKDLFSFLDIKVNVNRAGARPFPTVNAGLKVNDVSFIYPQTNKVVLDNVSLACAPGKIIAIVGENGSGKSTLVKLLARLYALQSGEITIGEDNTSEIAMADYRANSIFLFQDFEKYFLTIAENIAIGEEKETREKDIEHSAVLSGAHSFIVKLSKGYETRLGRLFEGSEQISGGQWQKLALSRIFYKKTQLLILDEPTSALDPTSEFELFSNIKDNLGQKMVILITHRLYNLKVADYVYVMENGKVAEEGSFDSLVNSTGVFKKMYEAQKL